MAPSSRAAVTESSSYFEQQRALLVGNEFSQVEGLWSQFENVMAKEPAKEEPKDAKEGAADD
ncbi:Dolichyl-diphosphooligosaccharide-protein glycosyltransferase subunit dad1 [Recurvomyces mirabilis]|nr:Dolichyl-diphosphooligosaccharide-protein glycosyltransferase subunit dad1 [Recurvomyces mirabilis]